MIVWISKSFQKKNIISGRCSGYVVVRGFGALSVLTYNCFKDDPTAVLVANKVDIMHSKLSTAVSAISSDIRAISCRVLWGQI